MPSFKNTSRRSFIRRTALVTGAAILADNLIAEVYALSQQNAKVSVNGHLWVYASKFPPNWDVTPNMEAAFADMSAAGLDGIELMANALRHDDAVKRISGFISKYKLPVFGSSYNSQNFRMWDPAQHQQILDDINIVVPRLSKLNGKALGISVGDARRSKTESELDAQATILKEIRRVCTNNGVEANLHNHTYEVANGMHDLKGTLARIPDFKLGPDLNWLIRGGVNPVDFINSYGKQMVYMHIRDQYADGRWTEYVGQGVTDFKAIAQALKAQHFKGDVAIELAFPPDFTPSNSLQDDWKISRQNVKKVFGW
ncbi:sugar phosphate isomerase/epimerase family protein [Flavitalea antarctica]